MRLLTAVAALTAWVFIDAWPAEATPKAHVNSDGMLVAPRVTKRGPRPPWPRRRRGGVKTFPAWAQRLRAADLQQLGLSRQEIHALGLRPRELRELGLRPRGQALIDLRRWPSEPTTPSGIKVGRFTEALKQLCPPLVPLPALRLYSRWIIKYAAEFRVDPMVVAALIYQQSRCFARKQSSWGTGLAMINVPMHRSRIRGGAYRFWVLAGGRWQRRQQPLGRFPFDRKNLIRPEVNIYFAAGILSVLSRQCPDEDGGFGSVPHRHAVSHFIWGDQVRGAGVEDRVLRARRRLIGYYTKRSSAIASRFEGLPLRLPLDGAPRKITSGLGDDRDGGKRRHTGVDFDSTTGEPVRAIADGVVSLAGVDIGHNRLRPLDARLTRLVSPRRMGPRGLLVMIKHRNGLVSSYMHLLGYVVGMGQKVRAGQLLGYVGRSGMKESDAHLHFGLQRNGRHIDPLPLFGAQVFPPTATYVGRNYLAVQAKRRKDRRRMRRARRSQKRRPWVGGAAPESNDGRPASPRRYDPSIRKF